MTCMLYVIGEEEDMLTRAAHQPPRGGHDHGEDEDLFLGKCHGWGTLLIVSPVL